MNTQGTPISLNQAERDLSEMRKEEEGTLYEAGRVVVQARAIVAMLRAVIECLPADARAVAMTQARQALADDPGALKILDAGLHIERDNRSKSEMANA